MFTTALAHGDAVTSATQAAVGSTVLVVVGVATAAVLVALVAASLRYPFLGIAMILVSVALSGYTVEVGRDGFSLTAFAANSESLTLRLEYLLVPAGAFALILGRLLRRAPIVFGRSAWLGAWIGVNILSSLLRSPALGYSLRMVYFYVVGGLAYLGVVNCATDRSRLRSVLILEAGLVAFEAGFALFLGGRWLDVGVVRLHGTFQEPVVFAGYMVPMSLLLLAWGIGSAGSRSAPRWLLPAAVAGLIASTFSMSRASWGMAILGACVVLFFVWLWRPISRKRLFAWASVASGLAIVAMLIWIRFAPLLYTSYNDPFPDNVTASGGEPGEPLEERIESDTWLWRLDVAREVLRSIEQSPFLGQGTLTFGQTHDVFARPSATPSDGWIPTGSLLALHDTGVIGLMLYGLLLVTIAFDAVRAMRSGDPEARSLTMGSLAGLIAWVGMEQMSTNMILGIGWVFLGLVSAASTVVRSGIREG